MLRVQFVYYKYHYRQNWTTQNPTNNPSKPIIMIEFQKQTSHQLYVFIKKNCSLGERQDNSVYSMSNYTGMCILSCNTDQLQAWCKHFLNGAQIGLVRNNHLPVFCYSFDLIRINNIINIEIVNILVMDRHHHLVNFTFHYTGMGKIAFKVIGVNFNLQKQTNKQTNKRNKKAQKFNFLQLHFLLARRQ